MGGAALSVERLAPCLWGRYSSNKDTADFVGFVRSRLEGGDFDQLFDSKQDFGNLEGQVDCDVGMLSGASEG
jgi:hypothetical protein